MMLQLLFMKKMLFKLLSIYNIIYDRLEIEACVVRYQLNMLYIQ